MAKLAGANDSALAFTDAFRQIKTLAESSAIMYQSLSAKLSRALGVPEDEIDAEETLQYFGIDSLLGVELQSWLSKEWNVGMPLFDIMAHQVLLPWVSR